MLPGAAPRRRRPPATDVTFTGQTDKHRDVAQFMTRLGLIPQLMGSRSQLDRAHSGDDTEQRATESASRSPPRCGRTRRLLLPPRSGGGAMRARGKEIYIITAVVAVVLIVAWYFLLFSPTQNKLSDLDEQIQSARARLTIAKQEVVQLESYKKTAPQSRAELVRLGKMLPESEGVPGLIVELTKTADASGVDVDIITRGTTTPGTPFGIQTAHPAGDGRFFDVEDFLYRLEEYVAFRNASFRVTGRLLQVTKLTLPAAPVTDASGSPPLTVTIGLNAYLWGGVAQAAAPGGAQ